MGNVKATYRKGRKKYDYKAGANKYPLNETLIEKYTTIPEPRIDWRKICEHAEIKDVPFSISEPSVSVKLI